jgi:hypothetical protein
MQVRQAAIQGRQLSVAASGQLGKVGVGHLSVPDDAAKFDISESHGIGTEFVASRPLDATHYIPGG